MPRGCVCWFCGFVTLVVTTQVRASFFLKFRPDRLGCTFVRLAQPVVFLPCFRFTSPASALEGFQVIRSAYLPLDPPLVPTGRADAPFRSSLEGFTAYRAWVGLREGDADARSVHLYRIDASDNARFPVDRLPARLSPQWGVQRENLLLPGSPTHQLACLRSSSAHHSTKVRHLIRLMGLFLPLSMHGSG